MPMAFKASETHAVEIRVIGSVPSTFDKWKESHPEAEILSAAPFNKHITGGTHIVFQYLCIFYRVPDTSSPPYRG